MSKLEVTAKTSGFRRAGVAWSDTPTEIDTADKNWTAAKIKMLKDEPELIVKDVVEVKETPAQKKAREKQEADAQKKADEEAKSNDVGVDVATTEGSNK